MKTWKLYLSGEIHTSWRDDISKGCHDADLSVVMSGPITDHPASDDCGVAILGAEDQQFWHDRKGAQVNAIRTKTLIGEADIVVVRFGEKYRQWNAAFDAGYASALGKPIIVIHPEEFNHALKEVDAAAMAVAREPGQVVEILKYVIKGELKGYTV